MPEDEGFQEGYDAYGDGVDPDDNPYPFGSEQHLSWAEGWSQAQLDDGPDGEWKESPSHRPDRPLKSLVLPPTGSCDQAT
jgi:hypothetical protein